jgi:DNA polymerase-1
MNVVLDIETDSLDAQKIHCIVAKDLSTSQVHVWDHNNLDKFKPWSYTVAKFIMHNGISFDVPILNRLLGTDIKLSQMIDTLVMSQLFNPMREGGHSLRAWGNKLSYPKWEYDNFTSYTPDMLEYCKNDVDLTENLYKQLLIEGKSFSSFSISLEHKIRAIIDQQEKNGFALNIQKTIGLLARLSDEAHILETWAKKEFEPTVVEMKTKTKYIPFNMGSRQQIANRLMERGWKPKQFTDKGNIIVSEEILNKINMEEAKKFSKFFLLQKRIVQIQSWINSYNDVTNRVHGRVLTLRTITGRMAHYNPNMAQIPAIRSPFGKECRDCWTVENPHTHTLVGTDASGLELRCLAHLMDDKDYINEVIHGDVHTTNMKMAGLTNRDQAKTLIYAFMYGAGAAKIGKIVGGNTKRGRELIERLLSGIPALKRLRNSVQRAAERGKIKGIDGRTLFIRSPHSSLNTLIQGAGASICKDWLVNMIQRVNSTGVDAKLVASIHDEYQFEVAKGDVKRFGTITQEAIKDTERKLKFNCPLDSTWKDGETWTMTH